MNGFTLNKINSILIFSIASVIVLYYARQLLIPIVFAVFLSMLMSPLSNKLERHQFSRTTTSLISLFIVLFILAVIGLLFIIQVKNISNDFPKIESKMLKVINESQSLIEKHFQISAEKQHQMVKNSLKGMSGSVGTFLKNFISQMMSFLVSSALSLFMMVLLLMQREKFQDFFFQIYSGKDLNEMKKTLFEIGKICQSYITGRILSILILTIMYTSGLLLVGIKNAFLLSFIAALLTIIPYIGTLAGGIFPFLMALVTEDSMTPAIAVLGIMLLVQLIDNYFIEPYVVGGEINLSALTTIIALVAGEYLWGAAGMILFLPMAGMIKVFCDHVDSLKPIGRLLGDNESKMSTSNWLKKKLHSR